MGSGRRSSGGSYHYFQILPCTHKGTDDNCSICLKILKKIAIFFLKLYQLNVDIKSKNIDNVNMAVLSMGMTGDYMTAIEEGATMIRVGTGIFGYLDKIWERNLV